MVWIVGNPLTTVTLDPMALKVIVVELLYTFVLVWVVHNVAATESNSGKGFYGLAIGFAVFI